MTEEEKIICKSFLHDADNTHSCNEYKLLMELLEQEPATKNDLGVDWESYKDVDGNSLDDLILEVLQNNFDCGNTYGYKVADEIIGLLPSVTPQEPRWIPVTERLPKERTAVLVWCPERKNIYCAYYEEKRWWIFGAYWEQVGMEIIAWMPLPKPYNAESEG